MGSLNMPGTAGQFLFGLNHQDTVRGWRGRRHGPNLPIQLVAKDPDSVEFLQDHGAESRT